jgi:hypothetical protein
MSDPYAEERRALVDAVTTGDGHLAPEVRTAIVGRTRGQDAEVPDGLVELVDRVAKDAPGIEDGNIDAAKAAGFDEAIRGIALTGSSVTAYGPQVAVGIAWLVAMFLVAARAYRFTDEP